MKFRNRYDERQNLLGFNVIEGEGPQIDTHTYSYLKQREMLKEDGSLMGLDKLLIPKIPKPTLLEVIMNLTEKNKKFASTLVREYEEEFNSALKHTKCSFSTANQYALRFIQNKYGGQIDIYI